MAEKLQYGYVVDLYKEDDAVAKHIAAGEVKELINLNGFFYSNLKEKAKMLTACLERSSNPKAKTFKSELTLMQTLMSGSEDGYELIEKWGPFMDRIREVFWPLTTSA
jgi:hypothetical protein